MYYGDEIGMTSEDGMEEGRAPMIWDRDYQDRELFDYVKRLIRLRKEHKALRIGDFKALRAEDGIYSYARQLGEQTMIVVLNNSPPRSGEFSICAPPSKGGGGGQIYTELLSRKLLKIWKGTYNGATAF